MKRTKMLLITAMAFLAVTVSGCGNTSPNAGNTVNSEESSQNTSEGMESAQQEITLYVSNENADGFDEKKVMMDSLTAENIIAALAAEQVVSEDTKTLAFGDGGDALVLDLSEEFQQYVSNYGTAGEMISVGGVVNTFLKAYEADTITILVNGAAWDTGHAEYEGPMGFYELP